MQCNKATLLYSLFSKRQFSYFDKTVRNIISVNHYGLQKQTLLDPQKSKINNTFILPTATTLLCSVRYRKSFRPIRPPIPSYEKALFLAVSRMKFANPLEDLPPSETCIEAVKAKYKKADQEVHPYVRILANELLEEVQQAPMFILAHQDGCESELLFKTRVILNRNNMKYLWYKTQIIEVAFKERKYQNLLPILQGGTVIIISHDANIQHALKIEKQLPFTTFLCAVLEDRIMSMDQLRAAAQLPSLPLMHATLVQTLGSHAQRLSQYLTHHQSELTASLARYAVNGKTLTEAGEERALSQE